MDNKLKTILARGGITTIEDLEEKMDGEIYQELYDYWLIDGQMPYGTAKARDGDPGEWMFNMMETMLPSRMNHESH